MEIDEEAALNEDANLQTLLFETGHESGKVDIGKRIAQWHEGHGFV